MSQNTDFQTQLTSELLALKKQIFSGYFDDPKIKKNFDQEIYYDFLLYDRLFRRYKCQRSGAIYAGGHKGEMLLTLVLLGFNKIIVVEPQPELFKQLQDNIALVNQLLSGYDRMIGAQQTTLIEAVQCAVGALNSEAEFYITSQSALSSLFQPIEEVIQEETNYSEVSINNQIVVPIKTIDSLIEQSFGDISDFNFLYMNIQGSELNALEGAKQTLTHLDSIYLEKNLTDRYEGCPDSSEIDEYLVKRDFVKAWEYVMPNYGTSYEFYLNQANNGWGGDKL